MNYKIKLTLIIIITLIFGVFMGAMLNRALIQHKIRRAFSLQKPSYFISNFEKIIDPDEAQAKLIREILEKHAKRVSEIRTNFRKEMEEAFESMKKEMDSILTAEQRKRLSKKIPHPHQKVRHFWKRERFPQYPSQKR